MVDLSGFNAKQLATFDREIQELRSWYDAATTDDRSEFKQWLTDLVAVAARQPDIVQFTLGCKVNILETDNDGNVVYDGVVFLSPKPMLAAVTAWDAGDEFVPSHWMETM